MVPDAEGVVTAVASSGGAAVITIQGDTGYETFNGATLDFPPTDPGGPVEGAVDPLTLKVGDHVVVWVDSCDTGTPLVCVGARVELF